MTFRRPPQARTRRRRPAFVAAVVVGATLVGVLGFEALTPVPGPTAGVLDTLTRDRAERGGSGRVPDGVTVFDDGYAAVARLDPDLLAALREAATDAADEGITIVVNSGWRSAAYQEQLLDEAVSEYGTTAEAARWVATPETSPHVSGDAVDVGPSEAASWLADHGASYGLCQVYANEPWHYELRPDAVDEGCPRRYADPTHDPRMQP
ncbi:M15 family metallopeptidase [Mumia sp. DW29H23]|uniref:M15 family metallopeptidase n=1 Tax=Mumia sp. DW29H23 TaxID=3421241 RepID=UPI003D684EE2